MTNVPYERKINMLSSTDNKFMICIFDFERVCIESWFPLFNSHCIAGNYYYYYIIIISSSSSSSNSSSSSSHWRTGGGGGGA